jgi:hypothetical protein
LQNHPWKLSIAYQEIRATAQELMRNLVRIEQTQEIRKTFVLLDAEEVRRTADAQRSKVSKGGTAPKLDVNLCKFGDNPWITNAHDASDAPFPTEP